MREYGQIQCSFWTDPDIQSVSNNAKLLAAYLLTGPHSNGLGCYRLPDGYVMADFGWNAKTLSEAFQELFDIGFAERCEETSFVLIPKFLHWNPVTNTNVAKAREKEFNAVSKKSNVFSRLIDCINHYANHLPEGFANRLETLSKQYGKQEPTQPNQNQPNPEPDPKGSPKASPCPYGEIVNLWNKKLPELASVVSVTAERKRGIKKIWLGHLPDLDAWGRFFDDLRSNDFCMGRVPPKPPRTEPWQADFDWVIQEKSVVKIVEKARAKNGHLRPVASQ